MPAPASGAPSMVIFPDIGNGPSPPQPAKRMIGKARITRVRGIRISQSLGKSWRQVSNLPILQITTAISRLRNGKSLTVVAATHLIVDHVIDGLFQKANGAVAEDEMGA